MKISSAIRTSICFALVVMAVGGMAQAQGAQAGWRHGIGTGMQFMNLEGDSGLGTVLGPIRLELDLDSSEVSDLIETAFGLGGFSAKGKWTFAYSGMFLELEAGNSGSGPKGTPASAVVTLEVTAVEFSAAYRFGVTGKHAWSVLSGLRYTDHSYEAILDVGKNPPAKATIENDWTDLLIGITHRVPFAKKLAWTNRLDGGFGGSEGSVHFNTALHWQVAKHWDLAFSADYRAVDFENGSENDSDWYLYDVDEFGFGISFAFLF